MKSLLLIPVYIPSLNRLSRDHKSNSLGLVSRIHVYNKLKTKASFTVISTDYYRVGLQPYLDLNATTVAMLDLTTKLPHCMKACNSTINKRIRLTSAGFHQINFINQKMVKMLVNG